MGQKCWYVIQSKPKKEVIVSAQLRRLPIAFDVFFPKIRNYLGIRPLFPSYLFVRTDMEHFKNYQTLKFTRGVLRVLSNKDGEPVSVQQDVVQTIKDRLNSEGVIDQSLIFRIGQSVKVQCGPLKDLIGILEKPADDEGRVQVLFKLLRYPLRAVLNCKELAVVGL